MIQYSVLPNLSESFGQRRRNLGYDVHSYLSQHRTRGSYGVSARGGSQHGHPRHNGRLSIDTSRMEQGSVKHVGVVSGSEHDHTDVAIEAGHLRGSLPSSFDNCGPCAGHNVNCQKPIMTNKHNTLMDESIFSTMKHYTNSTLVCIRFCGSAP